MIIRLKYFHENLTIKVILVPGGEFFSAKHAQFTVKFTEC